VVVPEDLKYVFAQFNPKVGDISYNKEKIIETIEYAETQEVDLVIFPELALSGYPPRDFLHYQSFHMAIEQALEAITTVIETTHVILGVPLFDTKKRLRNAAIVIDRTGIVYTYYKTLLPDYDVFDESRYFYPNDNPGIVNICGIDIGLQICEDAWDYMWMHPLHVTDIQCSKGAELIINISASPFTMTKAKNRLELVKNHVQSNSIPYIYVNTVGCQDDLVFDGRSFVVAADQHLVFATPAFETGAFLFEGTLLKQSPSVPVLYYPDSPNDDIYHAIILNLQDYLEKSHLQPSLLVALSGGIDSALTLTLASQAIGSDHVEAVYMPTKFSAEQSYKDSKKLCDNLGVRLRIVEIEDIRNLFSDKLHKIDGIKTTWSIADENIQARIRSNIMMYLSNSFGSILVSTGNKSEIATGYCTLYGDTAGGKNILGDLYKTQIYELARWINRNQEIIPPSIITRPPTAELKEDQRDEDSLPPYEILDEILALFVDQYKGEDEIVSMGFDRPTVKRVIKLVLRNEFKRDQMVQSIKLSDKAFGSGRRFPIASNYFP